MIIRWKLKFKELNAYAHFSKNTPGAQYTPHLPTTNIASQLRYNYNQCISNMLIAYWSHSNIFEIPPSYNGYRPIYNRLKVDFPALYIKYIKDNKKLELI